MRALVTGANGFVGSHLVRHLIASGWDVRSMVRRTSNVDLLEGLDDTRVFADITDPASLEDAVRGVDVVFHVAGAIAALDQAGFDRVNLTGTVNVVDAINAVDDKPRRLVLVSSIAAGGPSPEDRPRHEDDVPNPVSQYGHSKLGGERALDALDPSVEWVVVRPPVVYGSGDTATMDLYQGVRRGVIWRLSGGPHRLSFVHVHDLVEGMRLAATVEGVSGERYYLCGPVDGTMVDLQDAIARAMDKRPMRVVLPTALAWAAGWIADAVQRMRGRANPFGLDKVVEGTQKSWVVNHDKARDELGFEGRIGLDDGVREAIGWYRAHGWLPPGSTSD